MKTENKMGTVPVNPLIWSMGLPMVLSMILQAVYNVVDTIFVINSNAATQGNAALTAAFPVQILIIAIGVGTGVGINALLSGKLGEKDTKTASRVAGNGIFLALMIYIVFFLFGLFLAEPYMQLMSGDSVVVSMGTEYLSYLLLLFHRSSRIYGIRALFTGNRKKPCILWLRRLQVQCAILYWIMFLLWYSTGELPVQHGRQLSDRFCPCGLR